MKSHSSRQREIRRARPLLGTLVEITVPDSGASDRAIDRAFAVIARVQALMSAHDPNSDLGRLCRARSGSDTRVHRWTWHVLQSARILHRATGGTFDPIAAAQFGVATERLPVWAPDRARTPTWRDVRLLPGCHVRLSRPVRFDLGGIAKGFAVDRAVAVLRAARLEFGLVNAGGDMRAFGCREWPVHVRKPDAPGELMRLGSLREGSVASSGAYFSRQTRCCRTTSALFNPVSRRSLIGMTSATVFAPTCLVADALTKALLCGGSDCVLRAHRACGILMLPGKGVSLAA